VLMVADGDRVTAAIALGALRLEMGERLELRDPAVLAYVWVYRFPMFKWDRELNRWDATHNPFSAPVWEEADRMEADPGSIHAQQYDLALNGWELGGGSIRIHRRDLLERAFALMGHSVEGMRDQFGALLDALEYGAPPHGGIALGVERWVALLANQENIREVTAFLLWACRSWSRRPIRWCRTSTARHFPCRRQPTFGTPLAPTCSASR
jgi:aspartyl-tRNA synthetase